MWNFKLIGKIKVRTVGMFQQLTQFCKSKSVKADWTPQA